MEETRGTVLIVDDDADITDVVRDVLTDEGYDVETLRDRHLESFRDAVGAAAPRLRAPRRRDPRLIQARRGTRPPG